MKYGFSELGYYNRGIKYSALKPVTTVFFLFLLLLLPIAIHSFPLVSNYISVPYLQTLIRSITWSSCPLSYQLPHHNEPIQLSKLVAGWARGGDTM